MDDGERSVLIHLKQQVATLHENIKHLQRDAEEIRRWVEKRLENAESL